MNRRLLCGLVATALVATLLPGVAAAAPPKGGSRGDTVTGSGTVIPNPDIATYLRFSVSAHSGPDGQQPRAEISYREFDPAAADAWPGGDVRSADVRCMLVNGADAVIVAEFRNGARPFGEDFPYLLLAVHDNGQGRHAEADLVLATATNNPDCAVMLEGVTGFEMPLIRGNVEVRDTPAGRPERGH